MTKTVGLLMTGAQLALNAIAVKLKPQRKFGPMTLQVTIEENHTDTIEITDHPVEKGAVISDHAYKNPAEVTIRGSWSSSPSAAGLIDGVLGGLKATITGAKTLLSGKAPKGLNEQYDKLLELQKSVIPFDIFTGKRKYSNMVIRSLSVATDVTSENCLNVTLVCREVIIVSTSVTPVPTDKSKQANASKTAPPTSSGTKSLGSGSSFNRGRGDL